MNNLKLSKRLQTIVDCVDPCEGVADIGCDHGKVLAKLFLEGKIKYAIASDISAPSVEKTRKLLDELGYLDRTNVVVGDGLTSIEAKKIDVCIIAGMGGREILQIMQNAQVTVGCYILQPMSDEYLVRHTLTKNGYAIDKDIFFYDKGKYYTLLKVKRGKQKLSRLQKIFGVQYEQEDAVYQYVREEMQKLEEYNKFASKKSKRALKKRYKQYQKVLRRKR